MWIRDRGAEGEVFGRAARTGNDQGPFSSTPLLAHYPLLYLLFRLLLYKHTNLFKQ